MNLGFSSAWEPGHRIPKHGTLSKALRAEASAASNRASITAAATKGKMGVQQQDAAIALPMAARLAKRGMGAAVTLCSLAFHRNLLLPIPFQDGIRSRLWAALGARL
jgi:hypothetical protein